MRHHIRNAVTENSVASASKPVEASQANTLTRIAGWCKQAWLRLRGGLRSANGKVAKQFTTLSERQSSTRAEVQRLESAFSELRANVDALHARIHELEARERCTTTARGGLALNLTAKSQVLKLSRNGQSARTIANTLGVPEGEVEFLLKVQRLLNRSAGRKPEAPGEGARRAGAPVTAARKRDTPLPAETRRAPGEPVRIQ
jgi:hypothetical protein